MIQVFLPLYNNAGRRFPKKLYPPVRTCLLQRFGGLTAYTRAPVSGLWRSADKTVHDDLLIFEVMSAKLNQTWWRGYKRDLEKTFEQNALLVRAFSVRTL